MLAARFLAEVVAGVEVATDLRSAVVNLTAIHGIEEAALLMEWKREQLVRPAGGIVTSRQSLCFGVDSGFSADVLDRDENGKRPAAGAALVALITELDGERVSRVRH
jgi:hypothetical protein